MSYSVAQLAEWVGGTLRGDGSGEIVAALPFEEVHPQAITFLSERRLLGKIEHCRGGALLVPTGSGPVDVPTIEVSDPLAAILKIASLFTPMPPVPGPSIDPRSAIDPTAEIAEECYVGPFAVVEANVSIGRGCRIHAHAVVGSGCRIAADVTVHAHATLYPNTTIGERSIVHSGAVIGCDGFGYQLRDGRHEKIPQIGNVVIGADVEIGANSTVDRGTFGSTRVGDGTKIDNQVMIAHNCQIGRHNVFAGQVGIAGSSSTGDYVTIAGQVGIADHVHVGEQATLGADAGVYTDIPAGSRFVGTPARPLQEAKRLHLALERVPEMRKELLEVRRLLGLGKPSGDGTMTPPDERREAG